MVWRWISAAVALGAGTLTAATCAGAATPASVRPQIIGAQPVPAGALKQLAYVQDRISATSDVACTATVVSANLVLTAGHCVRDAATDAVQPASGFLVATGRLNLTDPTAGEVSSVSRVLDYPGDNSATRDGDAALLELATPTTVPAIRLAGSGQATLSQPGTEVAIAGWGLTNGSGAVAAPTQAQWATTVTQSADYCALNASLADTPFDPSGQLCAVDAPMFATGTCLGDSGGPMLADYGTADPIEVGIASWGVSTPGTSCDTHFPSFFTQAGSVSSWVTSWAQALAPPPAQSPSPKRKPKPAPKPKPKPKPKPVSASGRKPEAGTYSGTSSQHRAVRLHVTAGRDAISAASIGYRLHCSGGRRPTRVIRFRRLAISDLTFGARRRAGDGATYALSGTFDTTGAVSGTVRVGWHGVHHRSCRGETLRFKARR